MTESENQSEKTAEEYEHEYARLTSKQKSAVDVLAENDYDTITGAAKEAGVSGSYIYYVEDQFSGLIDYRQSAMRYATDGAGDEYVDVRLTTDEAFKAIRMLPAELSQVVYQAVRNEQK